MTSASTFSPRAGLAGEALPSDRRLNLLSVVLLLGAMTSILDTTIVNVALDHLHAVFHASVANTQWISSGYLLALAGIIPLTGWAAERFGARRVWMTAVAVFLLGSVLCGLSWNLESLIAFRVLQGIGGGMILPVTITILTRAAGPARLSRAISAIAIPAQLAPILGPVIGGALIGSVSWRWLFFVNVPLCVAALVLAPRFLPHDERNPGQRFDLAGFLMLTPGLVALALGISEAGRSGGFGEVEAWLPTLGGAVLLALFAVYSLRTKQAPLVDVRPFGRRSFGLASMITLVGGFSTFAVMFLLPLFYQQIRGESPFTTGLLLIPQGLGTITFVLANKRLSAVMPTRFIVMAGGAVTMLGILPFTMAATSGNDVLMLVGQFLVGVGGGSILLTIMTLAFADLDRSEIPRAGAAFSVVQRVGAPFGVTVVAMLLESALAHAAPTASAAAGAFGQTFWWVFAFGTVPVVLAVFLPGRGAEAGRTPEAGPEAGPAAANAAESPAAVAASAATEAQEARAGGSASGADDSSVADALSLDRARRDRE
jgi:EmrB/QacA subfamily drug resistance transporter